MGTEELGQGLVQGLLEYVLRSIPAGVGVGLSVASEPPRAVAGLGAAAEFDRLQWDGAQGPLPQALTSPGTVLVTEAELGRWPALAAEASRGTEPVRGMIASLVERGPDPALLLSVYATRPLDPAAVEIVTRLHPLIAGAVSLIEQCAREQQEAAQMREMVAYRRVIEQAKGLVMAAVGEDAPAAFETLARASQHFNVRLRNLAVALVEHVGHAPAEPPEDRAQTVVPSASDRRAAERVWAALKIPGTDRDSLRHST